MRSMVEHLFGHGTCCKTNRRPITASLMSPPRAANLQPIVDVPPGIAFAAVYGSPGRIRTSDQPVNSRLLYR
jgi:hypothetical protein